MTSDLIWIRELKSRRCRPFLVMRNDFLVLDFTNRPDAITFARRYAEGRGEPLHEALVIALPCSAGTVPSTESGRAAR